jgi:FKBP-type peptidyl-prolyl cis-trans isomerase SlyD
MEPEQIAHGKVGTFTYVILDTDGKVLEQSDLPMSYIHGVDGKMFPKVEAAMTGARVGDKVEAMLTPADGFGEHDSDMTMTDDVENVPPEYRHVGAEALFENEDGETITMFVTEIEDDQVTLDGNHPFAGKTVIFRLTVIGIRDATPQELQSGEVIDVTGPLTYQ